MEMSDSAARNILDEMVVRPPAVVSSAGATAACTAALATLRVVKEDGLQAHADEVWGAGGGGWWVTRTHE